MASMPEGVCMYVCMYVTALQKGSHKGDACKNAVYENSKLKREGEEETSRNTVEGQKASIALPDCTGYRTP